MTSDSHIGISLGRFHSIDFRLKVTRSGLNVFIVHYWQFKCLPFNFLYHRSKYFRHTSCSGLDEKISAVISLVVAQTWWILGVHDMSTHGFLEL